MQNIPQDWQNIIVEIHHSFTEYNYFTEETLKYFNQELLKSSILTAASDKPFECQKPDSKRSL